MDVRLQVRQYIYQEKMLEPGDHVIVGLSGGADSVSLLLLLDSLKDELEITISAIHIHHGIRGEEAEADAEFCSRLCSKRHIPLRILRENVPELARLNRCSLEEAGREVRYLRFSQAARRYADLHPGTRVRIAVAHQLEDQAETVLMHLCRGAGIRGLGAMAPVRDNIIRPLLSSRRKDIEAWLRKKGQNWREDGTNSHTDYTRNRVRNIIMPVLNENLNPRTAKHLFLLADQARTWTDYISGEADKIIRTFPDPSVMPADILENLPEALKNEILYKTLVRRAGASRITGRHVAAASALLGSEPGSQISLPEGLLLVRDEQHLCITRSEPKEKPDKEEQELPVRAVYSVFPYESGLKIPGQKYTKWFDYDRINGDLCIRRRQPGDYLVLAGVGRKSVSRYMIDAHIPKEERNDVPLLADGHHILWIIGWRMSAAAQVRPDTNTILQVSVRRRKEND
ncbi:MAG: tRNA lysidine(34) synthetase TilS [Lachnospiraceae bacterium]|nr:tRNA lysidine(34) synthetase TilS [Lachnospiraceae bacterium]